MNMLVTVGVLRSASRPFDNNLVNVANIYRKISPNITSSFERLLAGTNLLYPDRNPFALLLGRNPSHTDRNPSHPGQNPIIKV